MKNIIFLNSREGGSTLHLMTKADKTDSKTYLLKTSLLVRTGNLENGKKFLDPSGGPMLIEGSYLKEAEMTIKSIDHVIGYGYTITFI